MYHALFFFKYFFFLDLSFLSQSGESIWWRVCYQCHYHTVQNMLKFCPEFAYHMPKICHGLTMKIRAPDKFKPFKPCLKKICDLRPLKFTRICLFLCLCINVCLSVCFSQVALITFFCLNHGYLENNKFVWLTVKF